jgi:hypothetical protein
MRYVIAVLALFMAGWFGHSAYSAKELANAIQKESQRYEALKAAHDDERKIMERQIALDSAKAESRLRKAYAENAKLRAEAERVIPAELLIFARLCESTENCSVLYGYDPVSATTLGKGSPPTVTAEEIFQLIRTLDDNTLQANFRLAQLAEQHKRCK